MGWVHDIQHTYEWGLYVLAGTCVLASVTILFAARPIPPGVQQRLRGAGREAFEPLITQIGMMDCDGIAMVDLAPSPGIPRSLASACARPFRFTKGAGRPSHIEGEESR